MGGSNQGRRGRRDACLPALWARRLEPTLSVVRRIRGSAGGGLLGLLVLTAGCAHDVYQPDPVRVEAPPGQSVFEDCELGDGSSVPSDFPRGSLAPAGTSEHALGCGLSSQLNALGEPSLFPLPRAAEVYRVLWLRSGAHAVSVRFERQGDAGQLRGAQTGGKGSASRASSSRNRAPSPHPLRSRTSSPGSRPRASGGLLRLRPRSPRLIPARSGSSRAHAPGSIESRSFSVTRSRVTRRSPHWAARSSPPRAFTCRAASTERPRRAATASAASGAHGPDEPPRDGRHSRHPGASGTVRAEPQPDEVDLHARRPRCLRPHDLHLAVGLAQSSPE